MAKTGNPPPGRAAPAYERQSGIQVPSGSVDFSGATRDLMGSYDTLSAMGSNLANNMAIERATLDGVKAGKTPGRTLAPAFTQSTKAFNDAYEAEEYNTLLSDSTKYLNSTYFEASKNPNTNSLMKYEKNAKLFLNSVVDSASDGNKTKLQRDLESSYDSKYYQLAKAVESENERQLRQSFKQGYETYSTEVQDAYASGQHETAHNKYQGAIDFFNQQLESGVITPAEHEQYTRAFKLESQVAKEQAIGMEKIQDGKGPEYLAEWADKPNTEENVAIKGALYKQYNQYNQMKATNSHIAKAQGIQDAHDGTLTESRRLELEDTLTDSDWADFSSSVAKIERTRGIDSQSVSYIENIKNDAIALSSVPNKAIDTWYNKQIENFTQINGAEPSLKDKINIANSLRAEVPQLTGEVEAAILRGNGEQATDAMIAYSDPTTSKALEGISKTAQARALEFMDELQAGNDTGTALAKVNYRRDNLSPGQKEQWEQDYKELTSSNGDKDISNSTKLINQTSKALGYPKGDIPSGLPIKWERQMKKNYGYTGDWDRAAKMTKQSFDKTWGYSTINGEKQLMFMPPEKFIKNYPAGADYFRNQMFSGFKELSQNSKEFFNNNPEQDFYFDSDVKEIEQDNEFSPSYKGGKYGITQGGSIRAKKIFRDGTVQEGVIEMQSDGRTLLPQTGMVPNYYLGFVPDGSDVALPLKDPNNQFNPVRFHPDIAAIEKEIIKQSNAQRKKAYKAVVDAEAYSVENYSFIKESLENGVNPYD